MLPEVAENCGWWKYAVMKDFEKRFTLIEGHLLLLIKRYNIC